MSILKIDRPEFKQISTNNTNLVALDGNGDIWELRGAKWVKLTTDRE